MLYGDHERARHIVSWSIRGYPPLRCEPTHLLQGPDFRNHGRELLPPLLQATDTYLDGLGGKRKALVHRPGATSYERSTRLHRLVGSLWLRCHRQARGICHPEQIRNPIRERHRNSALPLHIQSANELHCEIQLRFCIQYKLCFTYH